MAAKLGAGFIGFGRIARSHLTAYRSQRDVEVLAIADPVEAARDAAKREYGIPHAFETWEELLTVDAIDLVSICTPHDLHEAPFMDSVNAGKQIFLEKPVSTSLASARRMLRAAEEAGTWTALGTPLRDYPGNIKVKEMLQAGRIGELELATVSYGASFFQRDEHGVGTRPDGWYQSSSRMGGGVLSGQCPHYFSLLTWLFEDEVKAITAHTWNVGQAANSDAEFDSNAVCMLEFKSGPRALMEVSWSSHEHPWGFEVYGSKGALMGTSVAGRQASYTLSLHGPAADVDAPSEGLSGARSVIGDPMPPPLPPFGYTEICADFVATVRNDRISGDLPTLEHGCDLQANIEAGYLSSRESRAG